jgi:hypothetical protein
VGTNHALAPEDEERAGAKKRGPRLQIESFGRFGTQIREVAALDRVGVRMASRSARAAIIQSAGRHREGRQEWEGRKEGSE